MWVLTLDDTIVTRYYITNEEMIINFKCKETEKIFNREWSIKFPPNIQERGLRKLREIEMAKSIHSMKFPLSNHLKRLQGKRKSQYSIRINDQWRICFEWHHENAYNVEILDYHN